MRNFVLKFTSLFAVSLLLAPGAYAKAKASAGGADAAEGIKLMQGSDCFSCHSIDQKIVGPAYKDVAKKYKGASPATISTLVKKVKNGGAGNWGSVPMVAHPQFSDDQIEKMVKWVLSVKPGTKLPTAGEAAPSAPAATQAAPSQPAEKQEAAKGEAPENEQVNEADDQVKDTTKLMEKHECFGCHFTGQEMPWPDMKQISARYKGHPEKIAALVKKVKHGGAGTWGKVPQVPYPHVSDAAMTRMVTWMVDNGANYSGPAAQASVNVDKLSGLDLLKTADCLSCHSVDTKIVGPAYKDVAARYKGAGPQVIATLVKKVKNGGSGNWGAVPMSPHPQLSDAVIEKMVKWELSQ